MTKKLKIMEIEKHTRYDVIYVVKPEKRKKCEMHTLRPGIWQETLKNVENETQTLYALEYGEKH